MKRFGAGNRKALIVVDVQKDFCPGGALAVAGGDEIIAPLNKVIELAKITMTTIFATRDWHPAKTSHFKDFGGLWPVHCVQDTEGAKFHPDLDVDGKIIIVSKGMGDGEDAYSGFAGKASNRTLREMLGEYGVTTVYVAGLATDYCVKATAIDAAKFGFRTFLIDDCCRAVNQKDGDANIFTMATAGITIIDSKDVYF